MYLPYSSELDISNLSSSLDNTTNSYKYYWFLSIIETLKSNSREKVFFDITGKYINDFDPKFILVEELIFRMLSNVWYPINYFHLSFGKLDQLSNTISEIKRYSKIPLDSKKEEIFNEIIQLSNSNNNIRNLINKLSKYVPYRFLRPWFNNELRGVKDSKINELIVTYSIRDFTEKTPFYCIHKKNEFLIELNKNWYEYLIKNIEIVTGFILWKLIIYLQKNNPNVPNVANKLFEVHHRDLKQAKDFWKIVLSKIDINCIYSGIKLEKELISIDHFIPWSFVSHDLLWNLVPTTKNINSSKNDNLPSLDKYLEPFCKLHYNAFKIIYDDNKKKILEDYTILYNTDLDTIYNLTKDKFIEKIIDSILPMSQIAINMGFQRDWVLK